MIQFQYGFDAVKVKIIVIGVGLNHGISQIKIVSTYTSIPNPLIFFLFLNMSK